MNNKGFTLIELIATIALLAIISVISVVSISNVLSESDVKECEELLISIKSSAKEYVTDNRYNSLITDNVFNGKIKIKVTDLVSNKYLTGKISNPFIELTEDEKEEEEDEEEMKKLEVELTLNKDYSAKEAKVYYNGNEIKCSEKKW